MKPGTELPWAEFHSDYENVRWCILPVRKDGIIRNDDVVADMVANGDAAYIVHACNVYPKLVKALRWYASQDSVGVYPDADAIREEHADFARYSLAVCGEEG